MTIRILIVEDQPLMRRGLRTVLELESGFDVVGEAASGSEAIQQTAALHPDVILMDVQMPGMNGIEATRQIVRSGLGARILILTTFDTEDYVLDGIRAGSAGYLLKDVQAEELCTVIRRVARGETFIQPAVAAKYLRMLAEKKNEPVKDDPLSTREMEVLQHLAAGDSNKEIAFTLGISENTVKNHVNNILGKLRVRNRTEAALKARTLVPDEGQR
jgi:DNA-binding NarL/FixJ family response regulator